MDDRMDDLRAEIGANDERIVKAVNERLRLVSELWELKRKLGVDRVDPERERALREQLASANSGPLSAGGIDELISELLALTKRELGSS
jgi:chorismate mutase